MRQEHFYMVTININIVSNYTEHVGVRRSKGTINSILIQISTYKT